jgi:hypothetical protein
MRYTEAQHKLALEVRAWRFRGSPGRFPSEADLATLTGLREAEVNRDLVLVRNNEAQRAVELRFAATQGQWGPGLARLRASHGGAIFAAICEMAAGSMLGRAPTLDEMTATTGIPRATVGSQAARVHEEVAREFAQPPPLAPRQRRGRTEADAG